MIDWDFSGLSDKEIDAYMRAVNDGADLRGHSVERSQDFIVRNYVRLAQIGELEKSWLTTYVLTSHFQDVGFDRLKAIFDACDRSRLQAHHDCVPVAEGISTQRISLFRGCAGPVHTPGMSWTTSLDKAIYYAKWHADLHLELGQPAEMAVYATTSHLAPNISLMNEGKNMKLRAISVILITIFLEGSNAFAGEPAATCPMGVEPDGRCNGILSQIGSRGPRGESLEDMLNRPEFVESYQRRVLEAQRTGSSGLPARSTTCVDHTFMVNGIMVSGESCSR